MGFKKLTREGEEFITYVCTHNNKGVDISQSNTMLQGNAPFGKPVALPFSSVEGENPPRIWKSNAKFNGISLEKNSDLPPALISWFNENASIYQLDANIVAAQAYQESRFKIWIYNPSTSSASGISQFTFETAYSIIVENNYKVEKFSEEEIAIMTKGTEQPNNADLWNLKSTVESYLIVSKNNRKIFFQNEIDNPNLMIKAQCRLLKIIENNNVNLASLVLFFYSRGSGYLGVKTYINAIQRVQNQFSVKYSQEGLNYVQHIFGYLGDKDNQYINNLPKPKGQWFGYSHLNLNEAFNPYGTDVIDSNILYPVKTT